MDIDIDFTELERALEAKSAIMYEAIVRANLAEIYRRGKGSGTPVRTGELRQSLLYEPQREIVGYVKEYAPHVEYGHRTRGGGYVQGQHFLQKNVEQQEASFKSDIIKALEG